MESIFSRLVSYSPHEGKSHLEDFTTELLVGVLERDDSTLINFLKYIIGENSEWCNYAKEFRLFGESISIEDIKKWKISTQYVLPTGKRPDICISYNNEPLVFIEHKVDSIPYEEQLKNYADFKYDNNKICLILLSKYYDVPTDVKNNLGVPFRTIWWRELFDFFKPIELEDKTENIILREFKQFLKDNKMNQKKIFEPEDLVGMKRMQDVIEMFSTILDSQQLRDIYDKFIFNSNKKKEMWRYRAGQIQTSGEYCICDPVLIDNDWGSVFKVGFCLNGENHYLSETFQILKHCPIAFISFQTSSKFKYFSEVRSSIKKENSVNSNWEIIDNGSLIIYANILPLNSLKSADDHFNEIIDWFVKSIEELRPLRDNLKDTFPND